MTGLTTRRQFLRVLAAGSGGALLAACAQPSAPAPAPTVAPAAQPNATAAPVAAKQDGLYAQMLEAAKKEGEINLWSENFGDLNNVAKVNKAFNDRVKADIKINYVHLASQDMVPRLVAEAQAGKKPSADSGNAGSDTLAILDREGLLEGFDWAAALGQEFPLIKQRAERVPSQFKGGKALDFTHNTYVFVYNKEKISQSALPTSFEDLGKPEYKGKFMIDPRGYPFNYMAPFWGEERVLSLARQVIANDPVFGVGSPVIAVAIGNGEAPFGIVATEFAEKAMAQGQPVDWVAPKEIPAQTELYYVVKGAPHANAARLFAAWMLTDGYPLLEESVQIGLAWPDSGTKLGERLAKSGTKFSFAETAEQLQQQTVAREKIEALYKSR